MKATNVVSRFLSLLDVTLILLGFLMITLAQASISDGNTNANQSDKRQDSANVQFVYVFASGKGPDKDKLFLLEPDLKLGRQLNEKKPKEIHSIIGLPVSSKKEKKIVVLMLHDAKGWTQGWTPERYETLKKTWNTDVVPIYDFNLKE